MRGDCAYTGTLAASRKKPPKNELITESDC